MAVCGDVRAEDAAGLYTNPDTGIVYRRVVRTVERPVVETKMVKQQQTVYMPKAVVETTPTTRRTYTPVTEYRWQPKVEGRWNPFVQPRVAYHHVPETRWQARDEVVAETKTRVEWESETKTVEVPQRLTRIAREEKVDFEPVGRIATPPATNVSPEIASKLRPLAQTERVRTLPDSARGQLGVVGPLGAPDYAGEALATRERPRSDLQRGMRATELMPRGPAMYGAPVGGGGAAGIAGLPPISIWR